MTATLQPTSILSAHSDVPPVFDLENKQQAQHVENVDDIAIEEVKVLPAFEELPLRSGDPKYAAWGLWGPDDEAGTLVCLRFSSADNDN